MGQTATAHLSQLIELVLRDTVLPPGVRRCAAALREMADRDPDRALGRLEQQARDVAVAALDCEPDIALARCVSVQSFWAHYAAMEIRDAFPDPTQYERYLIGMGAATTIEATLEAHVRQMGVLLRAEHSWLAPLEEVERRQGPDLVFALELGGVRPPLIMLVFPLESLKSTGVRIRAPRATDAVLGGHAHWRVTGLVSGIREFVDRDMPASALGALRWRP